MPSIKVLWPGKSPNFSISSYSVSMKIDLIVLKRALIESSISFTLFSSINSIENGESYPVFFKNVNY